MAHYISLCVNSNIVGEGAAVLLRALEPKENTGSMEKLRQKRTPGKSIKHKDLCNGPSKLCLSLDITKDQINKEDILEL
jgi:DNA-3-methyladenine glycosylase